MQGAGCNISVNGAAIWAENETLRWIADLAAMPTGAGGAFVSGGSAGNLSALVTARHAAAQRRGDRPTRWAIACAETVHSSVAAAARVMDVDVVDVPAADRGRLTGEAPARTLDALDPATLDGVFAVVASAGSTNAGTVDDLVGSGRRRGCSRPVGPRRRRLRRCRGPRAIGAWALRRDRLGPLGDRRGR